MRRPYDIERRGICLLRRGSLFCGLGNSDVKRFADAFEALGVAHLEFVGEEDRTRP